MFLQIFVNFQSCVYIGNIQENTISVEDLKINNNSEKN